MIPDSVKDAWNALPENRKIAVTRKCAKKASLVFQRWAEAAGLKSYRHETLVNRKANTGPRFDKALIHAEEGQLGCDILVSFFTEAPAEINDRYMELMKAEGNEEAETQLKVYAKILSEFATSPFIHLYLHTALWAEEFSEEDFEVIEALAAETSS